MQACNLQFCTINSASNETTRSHCEVDNTVLTIIVSSGMPNMLLLKSLKQIFFFHIGYYLCSWEIFKPVCEVIMAEMWLHILIQPCWYWILTSWLQTRSEKIWKLDSEVASWIQRSKVWFRGRKLYSVIEKFIQCLIPRQVLFSIICRIVLFRYRFAVFLRLAHRGCMDWIYRSP